jgi:molecular chaperone GrpE
VQKPQRDLDGVLSTQPRVESGTLIAGLCMAAAMVGAIAWKVYTPDPPRQPALPPGPTPQPPPPQPQHESTMPVDVIAELKTEYDKLREQLARTEAERDALQDGLRRTEADLARNEDARASLAERAQQEAASAADRGQEEALQALLPALDGFVRASAHAGKTKEARAVVEGLQMVVQELDGALGRIGVVRVPAVGQPFDPRCHEAVQQVAPSAEHPAGTAVAEVRPGYARGGRLIRAAQVVVAGGEEQ